MSTKRILFSSLNYPELYPDFLDIQFLSFKKFLNLESSEEEKKNESFYKLLQSFFPITDINETHQLDFLGYNLKPSQYSIEECMDRGLTYAVSLKIKLRLSSNLDENTDFKTIEQEVFLGNIPYMTPKASFVINGIERVIVSQMHKSTGILFSKNRHNTGSNIFSAKVVPIRGTWLEFTNDIYNILYVYIDRKKKILLTSFLKAFDYASNEAILLDLGLIEKIKVSKNTLKDNLGEIIAIDIPQNGNQIDNKQHTILIKQNTSINASVIKSILENDIKYIFIKTKQLDPQQELDYSSIYDTLQKDNIKSTQEARKHIYYLMRNMHPSSDSIAEEMFQNLFYNPNKYDLGEVGRYQINRKLHHDFKNTNPLLEKKDLILIVKHLIKLINQKAPVDDIDHLSNRRVKPVGEQLYIQFNIGLSKMVKNIKERLNLREENQIKPTDFINTKILSSIINSFFATNQLSQFMDQINPLVEMSHKRRISALGQGGLSKDRAGFEVRDIHYSQYGRICAVETPEGPNIGLIYSLALYARLNHLGFVETPYRPVKNGKVDMKSQPHYLTANEEDQNYIMPYDFDLDNKGNIQANEVKTRYAGDYPVVNKNQVSYMDIAPNQIVSVAAVLIPFLEHDDAARALMGSNMQKQAVPLLVPDAPIVGTGLEKYIAKDFRGLVRAEKDGQIIYVDSKTIKVKYNLSEVEELTLLEDDIKTYTLEKFKETNSNTCINLKPIVRAGDQVTKGQILCEGFATKDGELALGKNLKVAFMSWKGYTFEDAIVISERVVREDLMTSIHIDKFNLDLRNTKYGDEEFTAEIPSVSEDLLENLDSKTGLIKEGVNIEANDILIGKVIPKKKVDFTPEEKLLKAIFGDKAGDVKDVSLRVPPSVEGTVIKTQLFSREKKDSQEKEKIKKAIQAYQKQYQQEVTNLANQFIDKLSKILDQTTSLGVVDIFGEVIIPDKEIFTKKLLQDKLIKYINPLYKKKKLTSSTNKAIQKDIFDYLVLTNWTANENKNKLMKELCKQYEHKKNELFNNLKRKEFELEIGDSLPSGYIKLARVFVASKKKLKIGDKIASRHGNKGIVTKIVREEDMPFLADGSTVDLILNPLGVPSRMNLGQIYETVLGEIGRRLNRKYAVPLFSKVSTIEIENEMKQNNLPYLTTTDLYDGFTGEKFDQKVTVGVIYMLKLNHLVDDKMHARSIGPYSLVTQQPLGGKSQFGGQRFGEMEVWALEGFGAAHILQEMITIKSDDLIGRTRAYAAIVKGENIPKPTYPESFKVLIHELRSLGLDIHFK